MTYTDDNTEFVSIYRCGDAQLFDRVRGILESEDIEVMIRELGTADFPTSANTAHVVAVTQAEADRGREIITQAIEDEVISASGEIL